MAKGISRGVATTVLDEQLAVDRDAEPSLRSVSASPATSASST
jgi:hypothetical protein